MSLLAGESVGQTNRLMSAASIIDEMMNGAEAVIRKRLGSMVVDWSTGYNRRTRRRRRASGAFASDAVRDQL
jgi:hypothetical protein